MILKLLIFAIVAVMVYRLFGGKVPILDRERHTPKSSGSAPDEDTLVECTKCGTFVTIKESIIVRGKHYCSDECIPK